MLVDILKLLGISPEIIHLFFVVIISLGSIALFFIARVIDYVFFQKRLKKQIWLIDLICLPALVSMIDVFVYNFFGAETQAYYTTNNVSNSLLWLVFAWLFCRGLETFIWTTLFKKLTGEECPRLLTGFFAAIVYFATFYIILTVVYKKALTSLLIPTGIIAGVLGLALQSLISNIFAGLVIAVEKPYRVGDWIELPNGMSGRVIDITWRSTRLWSRKNGIYIIPNDMATGNAVHNHTILDNKFAEWYYIDVDGEVSPHAALELLTEAALSCEKILKNPAPVVSIYDVTTRPYKYMVYVYFEDHAAHWHGKSELLLKIQMKLMSRGIAPAEMRIELNKIEAPTIEVQTPELGAYLRDAYLFKSLSDDDLNIISHNSKKKEYYPGDMVIVEGEEAQALFVIAYGMLQVLKKDSTGTNRVIANLSAGTEFGEMSLLTGKHRSASVQAMSNCVLIEVPKESMKELLDRKPHLLSMLIERMVERRMNSEGMLDKLSKEASKTQFLNYTKELFSTITTFFELPSRRATKTLPESPLSVASRETEKLDKESIEDKKKK
ncbi:cyclic nucleotide-binding domain-containing protein [Candidatus Uabimicrobium sp. HlEnr_7]|uniref:cyclic nucleotide-binding domain-containing protein n=1 Tax=Candidatus Uabimicrobium helgolandensis TaxID=3095367 RepID=UPI003555DB89